MTDVILVKIGGSLLTDKTKPNTQNTKTIERLAKEIHEARIRKKMKLVVGHGGGSFPHYPAKKYRTHEGILNGKSSRGISLVEDAASRLNRIFVKALIDAGENAISVNFSSCCITKNGRIVKWFIEPIKMMLKSNLLPVPYGDVVFDIEKGCSIVSTETIIGVLPRVVKPNRIIVAGDVDGVYTADPFKNKNAKLIRLITPKNFSQIKKYLGGSRGIDVTGGMLHKVEEMLKLAKRGFEIEIINGARPGYLRRALMGKRGLGTIIRNS